ncbi:MAG: endonuclease NucS domain-containing protein [Anaerobacillus sp.]|uniref:endonuclease NucS domain-containing protein n=1 Tax=Anaerobacillus sp. TaxID=1872506 RepID=UPI00391B29CA
MYEADLTRALILNPNFIEEGLTFKGREVVLSGKRCDLLFEDRYGNDLYVEVKLDVKDKAVGQLMRYDVLVNDPNARFMSVGFTFLDCLKDGLIKRGFEYKEVSEATIASYLSIYNSVSFKEFNKHKAQQTKSIEGLYREIELLKSENSTFKKKFNFLL